MHHLPPSRFATTVPNATLVALLDLERPQTFSILRSVLLSRVFGHLSRCKRELSRCFFLSGSVGRRIFWLEAMYHELELQEKISEIVLTTWQQKCHDHHSASTQLCFLLPQCWQRPSTSIPDLIPADGATLLGSTKMVTCGLVKWSLTALKAQDIERQDVTSAFEKRSCLLCGSRRTLHVPRCCSNPESRTLGRMASLILGSRFCPLTWSRSSVTTSSGPPSWWRAESPQKHRQPDSAVATSCPFVHVEYQVIDPWHVNDIAKCSRQTHCLHTMELPFEQHPSKGSMEQR